MQIFLIVLGVLCIIRALHLSINKTKFSTDWTGAWFRLAISFGNIFMGTIFSGYAAALFIAAAYLK